MANKWSTQHYNAIAKEIRELFPTRGRSPLAIKEGMIERAILTRLALNLTKRFAEDNERFDSIGFLDACSPDTDLYPLSELWEEDAEASSHS